MKNTFHPILQTAVKIVLVAVAYFLSAKVVAPLSLVESGSVFAIWPPAGVALAAFFWFGYRAWPGIFIGALALNITLTPFLPSIQIAITNTLGPLLGFWLLQRYANKNIFDSTKTMALFFLSIIAASMVTSFGGVFSLWVHALVSKTVVVMVWTGWFLGDLIGFLFVTPLLVAVRREPDFMLRLFSVEGISMLAVLAATCLTVFGPFAFFNLVDYPVVYFLLPPLIWGALRFGSTVAVFSLFIVVVASISGTITGYGPFLRDDPNQSLLLLQSLNGMFAITILVMISIFRERELAQGQLKEYKDHLEELVNSRTGDLLDANKKLQELDHLKNLFLASISHELRTPLNAIIGFSGVLKSEMAGPLNTKQKEQLDRINKAGGHLLEIVAEVLDVSQIESGNNTVFVEMFSLAELISEAVKEIEMVAASKGLSIKVEMERDVMIQSDRRRLYQCLLNYLSNAVKFTEKSGMMIVRVEESAEQIQISVIDNGIGIANEDQSKLFEPFERLESHLKVKAGGTGLGLYLTRKIIEDLLDGSVWVQSAVGEGSTFGLTIPKIITDKMKKEK